MNYQRILTLLLCISFLTSELRAQFVDHSPANSAALESLHQRLQQLEAELNAVKQQQQSIKPTSIQSISDHAVTPANAEFAGSVAEPKKPDDPMAMSGKWNNGLEFSTKDKNFKVHIGGRTQLDGVWFDSSPEGFAGAGGVGDQDSINFRRARLRIDGTFYKYYDFAAEYDFVNDVNDNIGLQGASDTTGNVVPVPVPTDLYITAKEVPLIGNVRFGNFKPQIGFEHITSSRFLHFMERSYNQDAFYGPFNNGFSPGMGMFDTFADEHGTWAVGLFKHSTNPFAFDAGDGEYDITGRVTLLPIYDEASKGRTLLHLGLAGSHRDTNDNRTRFRARGSLRNPAPGPLNPVFADTGVFFAESQSLISPEVALVLGPWTFAAEYTGAWVDNAFGNAPPNVGVNQGTVYFQGWYVEALYFLTGEHREYERKEARFGRVIPDTNGYLIRQPCDGPLYRTGAWQIGARYSKLDLSDEGIRGGTTQDVTVGLNWYLNPNFKYQWNYVYTRRDSSAPDGHGDIHGAGMRVAFDF